MPIISYCFVPFVDVVNNNNNNPICKAPECCRRYVGYTIYRNIKIDIFGCRNVKFRKSENDKSIKRINMFKIAIFIGDKIVSTIRKN